MNSKTFALFTSIIFLGSPVFSMKEDNFLISEQLQNKICTNIKIAFREENEKKGNIQGTLLIAALPTIEENKINCFPKNQDHAKMMAFFDTLR